MAEPTILAANLQPGVEVVDGDSTVTITRRHQSPKGKVTVCYCRNGGGHGMTTLADTERLVLA